MDYTNPHALVGTAWLAANLDDPEVRAVDATFFLPTVARDAAAEFAQCHIPGAVFFDIDAIADRNTDLPHMLPDAATFSREVGCLGIGNGTHVVVYDLHGGCAAAARLWWTLRAFGHERVAVLDGGQPKWQREGRPTETGTPTPEEARFEAKTNPAMVRAADDLLANIASRAFQVIDARSAGRFAGAEPEPRPAKKAGHIPGSVNPLQRPHGPQGRRGAPGGRGRRSLRARRRRPDPAHRHHLRLGGDGGENGGGKSVHGSGGISQPRAE